MLTFSSETWQFLCRDDRIFWNVKIILAISCCEDSAITFFTLYGSWELKTLVNVGLRYTDVLNPCSLRDISSSRNDILLLPPLSNLNSTVDCIKFTCFISSWDYSWCCQYMKVSSTHLCLRIGFSNVESDATFSKYSVYILVIGFDIGDPIANTSSCRYMPVPILIMCQLYPQGSDPEGGTQNLVS